MNLFKKLLPYLKPHIKRIVLGLLGMGLFTIISLLPPMFIRYLVNDIIQPRVWELLIPVIILIISVPILAIVIQFINTLIISRAGYKFIADIRMTLYSKIFSLSMSFHQENSSGLIVNRLMDDVNVLMRLITGDTVTMIIDLIVFIFSLTIVFTLSPFLALILLGILVLYVFVYRYFAKKIKTSATSYRFFYDRISERLEETVTGARHVRIYNKEIWENDQFLGHTSQSLRHALAINMSSVNLSTTCNMIAGFGSAAIAAVGAYFVLQGKLRYGDLFAINSYIWMALNPAIRLTNIAGQMTETFVSVKRIMNILDEQPDISSIPDAPPLRKGKGGVEFRNVDFSYDPEIPLYKDLSLKIDPGMSVALVGHTGCGKTTLTTLLMRYWDIQKGKILINGINIKQVELNSLRKCFGVVLQDPVIFSGTFAENITYGYNQASIKEIIRAAKVAEIYNTIMKYPDGFETVIGSRGIKLSVGEKQRIGIARAIIKDPIILIMDEATSSLDSESESLIQKALDKILKDRTSFVVAHRLSTITSADVIIVMDGGKIVEKGKHNDLMSAPNGPYRKLYEELRGSKEESPA
ncbi:MAG: ABC transporter ATP-binding protein [Spirochaetes bacterium]|nr:ABC transporter ATP-binding protein [Spirochaetota bacterium]